MTLSAPLTAASRKRAAGRGNRTPPPSLAKKNNLSKKARANT